MCANSSSRTPVRSSYQAARVRSRTCQDPATEKSGVGPELTVGGLVYHRPGMPVHVEHWQWKHEAGFGTAITRVAGREGTCSERWAPCTSQWCLLL